MTNEIRGILQLRDSTCNWSFVICHLSLKPVLRLHVFLQSPRADLRPVDVAHGVRRDTFRSARGGIVRVGFRIWNEGDQRAVSGASDPDAPLPSRVPLRVRLRVGHVDSVVPVDVNPAWPAELFP